MKKLSFKKLKSEVNDTLQRDQLKAVFGGGVNRSDFCTCKFRNSGSASTTVSDCSQCRSACQANYPQFTSWICTG